MTYLSTVSRNHVQSNIEFAPSGFFGKQTVPVSMRVDEKTPDINIPDNINSMTIDPEM